MLCLLEQPADQRVAVGVGPAGREADDRVPLFDQGARDQVAALADRDAEPGQVEVVGGHHVGVFRRLAAEQRTAGLAAALGDALDQFDDGVRHELAARDQVEEECRPAAGRQDVVDAHGNEVDAKPVQPSGRAAEQHLGADPVASGGQHRVADRGRVEPGEPTQVAEHLYPLRRGNRRADPLHHLLPGGEVDSRVPVGHAVAQRARARSAASNRSLERRMSSGISVGYSPVRQARQKRSLGWPVETCRPSSER